MSSKETSFHCEVADVIVALCAAMLLAQIVGSIAEEPGLSEYEGLFFPLRILSFGGCFVIIMSYLRGSDDGSADKFSASSEGIPCPPPGNAEEPLPKEETRAVGVSMP